MHFFPWIRLVPTSYRCGICYYNIHSPSTPVWSTPSLTVESLPWLQSLPTTKLMPVSMRKRQTNTRRSVWWPSCFGRWSQFILGLWHHKMGIWLFWQEQAEARNHDRLNGRGVPTLDWCAQSPCGGLSWLRYPLAALQPCITDLRRILSITKVFG